MSIYCMSDLHGKYQLFSMALDKIGFDYEKDKMYILGDIIDINYGAIEILRHMMKHPDSFDMIIGNHEFRFLDISKYYDTIMLHDDVKLKVKNVMGHYLDAFYEVTKIIKSKLWERNSQLIRSCEEIYAWQRNKNGVLLKKRALLLDAIIELVEYLDFDEKKISDIFFVLYAAANDSTFKSKHFILELLEICSEEYIAIKEYLSSKKNELRFTYLDRDFYLTHALRYNTYGLGLVPNSDIVNQYAVYGHVPVVRTYYAVHEENFEFNYLEIFSYIDRFNNRYFCLDMGDICVAVLRLDDLEEFYVSNCIDVPKRDVEPPADPVNMRKVGYKKVSGSLPIYESRGGYSIVTYKDYCMEYFIGVDKFRKKLLYKRIAFMQSPHKEVIENWYDNHTIEEVIAKVAEDYYSKKDSELYLSFEKMLRYLPIVEQLKAAKESRQTK